MQAPLRVQRREGAREWLAGAVTRRRGRERGQARDDREDRRGMIANLHSRSEYSFITSLIYLLARSSELPRRGAA